VSEADELIVGSDWEDAEPRPLRYSVVHAGGIPHRAAHVEVWRGDRLLVWSRSDGKLELPGGHLRWRDDGPEPSPEGAARELLEELGEAPDGVARDLPRVRAALELVVASCFNQSMAGKNNEWVSVYRVAAERLPLIAGVDRPGALSSDGNRDARWWSVADIREFAERDPLLLASSLKLLLDRQRPRRV
jgi:ADP-ribose pyrophosphatase YjhB (NUDIX family)